MTIGVLKEPSPETRVSLLAEAVSTLTKKGITVIVESGAGEKASCSNADYEKAGAQIKSRNEVAESSDIILSIHQPGQLIIGNWQSKIFIGVYQPLFNTDLVKEWASKSITTFSLDMLPRTTRAQSMDVLSSQANIAGYKAVLDSRQYLSQVFPHVYDGGRQYCPCQSVDIRCRCGRVAGNCYGKKIGRSGRSI